MSLPASVQHRSPLLLTFGIAAALLIAFAVFTQVWTD